MNENKCIQFLKNDSINPLTFRKIKKNGPTYKRLKKECEKKSQLKPDNLNKIKEIENKYKICKKMIKDDSRNPFTGRKIKRDGPTYKKLLIECQQIQDLYKINKKIQNDKKIKSSLERINTSVRKVMKTPQPTDLNLIVKHETKKIKRKQRLEAGTFTMQLIMIYYLLHKYEGRINYYPNLKFDEILEKINNKVVKIEDNIKTFIDLGFMFLFKKNNNIKKFYKFYPVKNENEYIYKLKTTTKRFTITLLTISIYNVNTKTGDGHANAIIYDKQTKTAYRFEPHGQTTAFDSYKVDDTMREYFKKHSIKYENLTNYCPIFFGNKRRGPQTLETGTINQDPSGFCSFWTTYFLDFLLENQAKPVYKNNSVGDMMTIMIQSIHKNFKNFRDFIRTYGVFFNELLDNIGKKKNIDRLIKVTIADL